MPETIVLNAVLVFAFYSFIFGFFFAIGQWLWSLIVGGFARRQP
jgi:hypothetical protein